MGSIWTILNQQQLILTGSQLTILIGMEMGMCDCRVCKLEFMYPAEIDRVVKDVFEYLLEDK